VLCEDEDREAGGLLAGRGEAVTQAWPARNVALRSRCEFAIQPEELSVKVAQIERLGLELLGTYHSHPNGNAQMSNADAAMARSTGLLLLVGLGEAWDWRLWDPAAGGEVDFAIRPPHS